MIENINWYPGHMKKTRELIRNNLKMVDIVIEVIDARIPQSSRNPIIDELVGDKPRIIVLNKKDLADPAENRRWIAALATESTSVLELNCMSGDGIKKLLRMLEEAQRKRVEALNKAAESTGASAEGASAHTAITAKRKSTPFRMMVVGVPNVGKSSLINRLTGKKSAQTGDRPGVTKGKQWLTIPGGMQLLDTPGILWPKFEDPQVGLNLAYCGSIRDEILDVAELALSFITEMQERYPGLLMERYKLEELAEMPVETMEMIAQKRGFILPGKRIDYERCARTVLDEFRGGKIGQITLEVAP